MSDFIKKVQEELLKKFENINFSKQKLSEKNETVFLQWVKLKNNPKNLNVSEISEMMKFLNISEICIDAKQIISLKRK